GRLVETGGRGGVLGVGGLGKDPRRRREGEGARVDLASRTPTSAVIAPLCPGSDRQPSLWRCLRCRHGGIADRQPPSAGIELQSTRWAVSAIYENLEFGRC